MEKVKKRIGKKVLIGGCCAGAALLIGIQLIQKKHSVAEGKEKKSEYSLVGVRKLEALSLRGTVDSGGTSDYYVQESKGELDQVNVKNGQKVTAGDVLFTYKNSETEESMYDKQAELARAKAELVNLRGALADAQKTGESEAIRAASREVATKEVEVNQAASSVERLRQKTARSVTAEVAGVVVVNESAKKSGEKPLVQILPETSEITGSVSEFDYDKIHEGDTVEITTMSSNQKVAGTIEEIGRVPQAKEGEKGEAMAANYSFKVKPSSPLAAQRGFSVQLVKNLDYFVLPKSAFVKEKAQTFVFVYKNGKASKKAVDVIKNNGTDVIKDGVSEKETVISNPSPKLKDGMEVSAS